MSVLNAMTVDVEDYFQVSAFSKSVSTDQWDELPHRVEDNTKRLLDLFDNAGIKSTFFVLGWVAERQPALIQSIAERGHEVACHGYSHQLVYHQTPDVFREETLKAKNILEDIIQQPVRGYRAASYSITRRSLWALDILADAGFEYDSSIFPIKHDRYGMSGTPKFPYVLTTPSGKELIEFPLSTAKLFKFTMPVAGGGYFRLYPYWVSRAGLKQINKEQRPFIFYLHPWEIDPQQPRIDASLLSRFRHYNNLGKCESRLRNLVSDFSFTTTAGVLDAMSITDRFDISQTATN